MKLKKYDDFVNESILGIAGGVIVGILGYKVLKYLFKKLVGKIGMNVPQSKERLKEILKEVQMEVLKKDPAQIMLLTPFFSSIKNLIESGDITTSQELLDVIERAGNDSKKIEF